MIQCHIRLLYYLVGHLTNPTDVCVCNQNWIEKKLVAMCFCNTNAQKCETSVKKLIAQKKQSTLCHRCHRGVSCTKIYLLHQSFVVCMASTSGSTWILVSEKKTRVWHFLKEPESYRALKVTYQVLCVNWPILK